MAINPLNLSKRTADRHLFLLAAAAFPLIVLIGYFKTYYFSAFFDVAPLANRLVHFHGLIMSLWVVYFVAQIALIRSKNIKLHMSMGMFGIVLAGLVIVIGLATTYDAQLVRKSSIPGIEPLKFFLIPLTDIIMFAVYFGAAVYYRKRPAEHKTLMLLTAINFIPAALARFPGIPPQIFMLWLFGTPALIAVAALVWHSIRHGKINRVFAVGVVLFLVGIPFRLFFPETEIWMRFATWLAP